MPNKLTDQQRIYVVRRLAAFDKPRAIARDMKDEFGITVSHQLVESYHPGRAAGRRLAPRWKALFVEARAEFLDMLAETGAMLLAVRVHWREAIAHDAWDAGLFKAASDVLDAIAKDIGGTFDKRKKDEHGRRAPPAPATINLYGRPERPVTGEPAPEKAESKKPPAEAERPAAPEGDAAPAAGARTTTKTRG
jgi:hypothetical protein